MGLFMMAEEFRDKHRGEPCLVMGNGPSLDAYDLSTIKCKTVGINRSWRKRVADYHCTMGDRAYLREIEQHKWEPKVLFVMGKRGEDYLAKWTYRHVRVGKVVGVPRVVFVPKGDNFRDGYGCDLARGIRPGITGHMAIMVAVFLGFSPICLLGYDCNQNEGHFKWYGDGRRVEPFGLDFRADRAGQITHFDKLAPVIEKHHPDTEVLNLSPRSAIKCWPFADFHEVLGDYL
jgi:hypothetical protein